MGTTQARPLPQAIRAARLAHGLTQEACAARVGVSQGTMSFWENGTETPTIEHLIILALELPEITESFAGRERGFLQQVLRLEHGLFAGHCARPGCTFGKDRS
jgi:transcriptional regulator with XRE-family HTH domain